MKPVITADILVQISLLGLSVGVEMLGQDKLEESFLIQTDGHHLQLFLLLLFLDFTFNFLASLSPMKEDTRVTWHGRSGMLGWGKASSSPLLLSLGLKLTMIYTLLL